MQYKERIRKQKLKQSKKDSEEMRNKEKISQLQRNWTMITQQGHNMEKRPLKQYMQRSWRETGQGAKLCLSRYQKL